METQSATDGVNVGSRKTIHIPLSPQAKSKRVLDITVLMGGPSSEREVSLVSGAAIADALVRNGHKVTRSDISPSDVRALDRVGIDLVFIALHGDFGESGHVQRLCEERGLRYIGSGPRASELAMDKSTAKEVFARAGLLVPPGVVVRRSDLPADGAKGPLTGRMACLEGFEAPVVIKPVDGGSSVDVVIAHDDACRDEALVRLLAKYDRLLVERFIKGRELTVGVLGEQALPIIEIVPDREFYDFTAKYSDDAQTRYLFDHGIEPSVVSALQKAAVTAHQSLGCLDMSRVDFILEPSGRAYVLEINTIPGFTSHSLLPKAAGKIGIGFDQLVDRIVAMAMAR